MNQRVGHKMKCTILRLWGANSIENTSERIRSGRPSCFLFGHLSCDVTSRFCSCQYYRRLVVYSWIKEWVFSTVHTTKTFVGNNDLRYPVYPEAVGLGPSM